MIDLHEKQSLAFPVPFPDIPDGLLCAKLPRSEVHGAFGPPQMIDWVDGLGDTDFWAFKYPCGLQMVIEYLPFKQVFTVLADSPEVEHVVRHLPFDKAVLRLPDEEYLDREFKYLLTHFPDRRNEIETLHSFQVWRTDDNGNSYCVGEPTSERNAKCRVAYFDSLGHKQTYWYRHV